MRRRRRLRKDHSEPYPSMPGLSEPVGTSAPTCATVRAALPHSTRVPVTRQPRARGELAAGAGASSTSKACSRRYSGVSLSAMPEVRADDRVVRVVEFRPQRFERVTHVLGGSGRNGEQTTDDVSNVEHIRRLDHASRSRRGPSALSPGRGVAGRGLPSIPTQTSRPHGKPSSTHTSPRRAPGAMACPCRTGRQGGRSCRPAGRRRSFAEYVEHGCQPRGSRRVSWSGSRSRGGCLRGCQP